MSKLNVALIAIKTWIKIMKMSEEERDLYLTLFRKHISEDIEMSTERKTTLYKYIDMMEESTNKPRR